MIAATIACIAGILVLSIAMSIVQFRRTTPLVFRCVRCGAEFQQAPHRDFPRACRRCGARDWAV